MVGERSLSVCDCRPGHGVRFSGPWAVLRVCFPKQAMLLLALASQTQTPNQGQQLKAQWSQKKHVVLCFIYTGCTKH